MKVFIFEHICGGGMAGSELPAELAAQGAAMLGAAAGDFYKAGVAVAATIDVRAASLFDFDNAIDIARVHDLYECERSFDRIAQSCDAVLIIAPEFGGILEAWSRRAESLGVASLGSTPAAIALCADKLALAEHLQAAGISTPPTQPFDDGNVTGCEVVKPRHGAGCEHTFVVTGDRASPLPACDVEMIIQPFIDGDAVSVSLLIHAGRITPLPPGRQIITTSGTGRLTYGGGQIPLPVSAAQRATQVARRAAATIAGLRGFVGVDLILTADCGDQIIEINPRLTVSFVALRRLCKTSLAAAMFDAAMLDVGMLDVGMFDADAPLEWSDACIEFDAAGRCNAAIHS